MSENDFTKRNRNIGVTTQDLLNAKINPFAVQLLIESFTDGLGKGTESLKFVYRGIEINLKVNQNAT